MKNNYRRSLALTGIFAFFFTYNSPTFSQNLPQKNISGIITSGADPLIGVNVLVKNSARGSISDLEGRYSVRASANDTLVFTYVGYKLREVAVGTASIMNVVMEVDAQALDAVVINAGYYKVSDREKTGSIARITAAEIENQPVSSPLAAMQGRMAGVNIVQNTGVPGGGFSVRIRGRNSIRADGSEPLYIVDGVPYPSQSLGNGSVSTVLGGAESALNGINPNDIESIEVLKDADATAIYGSRGANGVILITTKRGKSGKTTFSLNTSTGVGSVTRSMELLNTEQYLAMRREAFANDGITEYPYYEYDINGTWDQTRYTDWQEELIGGTAYYTTASASVQGGDEHTQFLVRGGYEEQTTVFPGDFKYKKGSALVNLNHTAPNDKFKIQFSGNYVLDDNKLPAANLVYQARTLAPNAPTLYTDDGELNWEEGTFNNPLAALNAKYLAQTDNLIANVNLSYKVFKDLQLKTNLGYNKASIDQSRTNPSTVFNPNYGLNSSISSITLNTANRKSWIVEPQLDYSNSFGKAQLSVLVGGSLQQETATRLLQFARGFTSNSLIYNLAAASQVNTNGDSEEVYRYRALFGRLNINYDHKYILNLTARRDGSSRFGPDNQYANFGALGAAWIFSEEAFIKNQLPFISYGKLRGSYGTTGNDQIGNYGFLDTYTPSGLSYQGIQGLQPVQLFNPNYGWELNKKLEATIEMGLFKDRVNFSVAYYRNRSSNQLVGIPLPGTTGFSGVQANLDATVENTGMEVELATVNVKGEHFQWKTSFNISLPKNKLLSFPGLEASTYANQLVVGQPLDISLLYNFTGVDPETGLYTFEDVDGDGSISKPNDLKTVAFLGPEYYGGLQNSLSYKTLSLDFLFQFVKKKGRNYMANGSLPGTMANQPVEVLDRWQNASDQSTLQRFSAGYDDDAYMAYINYYDSTGSVGDASYIRLKNIALSYTLPTNWSFGIGCRIYAQAQNLLTFTKYEGPDPETEVYNNLPPLKMFSTGVEFTF
ncbi:MAG: SusC/RagA family TonB-linked outer membrane protein [Aequorivita antarctica]